MGSWWPASTGGKAARGCGGAGWYFRVACFSVGTIGSCCLSSRPLRTSTSSRGRPSVPSWSTLIKSSPTSSSWRCCSSGQPMASSSSSPMPGAGWTSSSWLYVSCFLLPSAASRKTKTGTVFPLMARVAWGPGDSPVGRLGSLRSTQVLTWEATLKSLYLLQGLSHQFTSGLT